MATKICMFLLKEDVNHDLAVKLVRGAGQI